MTIGFIILYKLLTVILFQLEATLDFLLLSSERSFKMSQAYYDYEALEQLLEERERDLELAARIGQTLLEKNRELASQVKFLYILCTA